jgi:tetratricopeptide (TPR) repeat protein
MEMELLPTSDEIATVLATCSKKENRDYARAFRERSAAANHSGWKTLSELFDFHFKPDNASEPFGPMAVFNNRRSMIPGDLSDEQLDELHQVLTEVSDPEFQARVADVLWLRRKDPVAARLAVEAYLESGARLEDPEHWVASMERYERAARLAQQIDAKGDLPEKVLAHLQERVRYYNGGDPLYFSLKALELLEEFGFGNFAELAEIALRIAERARESGDYRKAREHFDIGARLLRRAKDNEGAEAARVASAECFVEEAEAREREGSFMASRVFWEQAVRAFRDRPFLRPRVPALQERLTKAGERTLEEMQHHSVEIDLSKQVEYARKSMKGLSLEDAFFQFVMLLPLIDPDELRSEAEQMIRDHPLQATISASIFDAAGRKTGIRPSAFTDHPDELEAAITGFMEQNARFYRDPSVHGLIAPAMRQLLSEHEITEDNIERLIGDSALIEEDRRPLFVQAIAAGFRWDFSTALHILVPQVENGLRRLLRQRGVLPINVDATGIEEVWSYERILRHPTTAEVLGKEMTYELWSLLVERLGPNLRNLIAHGLLSSHALNGETGFYLWWILLRLIAVPTAKMQAFAERRIAAPKDTNLG